MNLNRKVVEGSIVAGMLVVMTTTTSVTSQVVSNADTVTATQTVVAANDSYAAVAGITRQMAMVETGEAEVSVEQSDAQVVAASGADSADEAAQTELTETLPADAGIPVAGAAAIDVTAQTETPADADTSAVNETSADAEVQTDADTAVDTAPVAEDTQTQEDEQAAAEMQAQEDQDASDSNASSEAVTVENTANAIQSDAVTQQLQQEQAEWQNRLMPSVNEYLNIRAAGDENAEVVGKLYKGDAAEIVEQGDAWTHVRSGSVDGYVLNSYCAFGLDAYTLAKQDCQTEATVMTGGLRLRTEPNENATVIDAVYEGQVLTVDTDAASTDGWVAVEYDDKLAYVAAPYVSIDISVGDAISIEEERAAAAAEAEKKANESSSVETTQKAAVSASADDVTLLAALIQLEAGSECYEGKVAVGAVVMNRVRSGSYPNSISGVIYQGGQFTTASSVAGVISGGVSGSCMQAAQEAIGGSDNTGGCVSFRRASSGRAGVVIGNHVFF